jgi:hypothetical protein
LIGRPLAAILLPIAMACTDPISIDPTTGPSGAPRGGTGSPPVVAPVCTATAQLRVVNAVSDAPNVNLLVDGSVIVAGVASNAGSGYRAVPDGTHTLRVRSSDMTTLVAQSSTLSAGRSYTVIMMGVLNGATQRLVVLDDEREAPRTGRGVLRVVHASAYHGDVDVYVTAPDADIATVEPTLTGVSYGTAASYLDLAAGIYRVRVMPSGGKLASIDVKGLELGDGARRTLVAADGGCECPGIFGAIVLTD